MASKPRRSGGNKKARAKPARKASRPRPKARPKPSKANPKPRPSPASAKSSRPRAVPAVRPPREEFEEQTVCSLEFLSDGRSFIARLDTTKGGMREHKAPSFTDLLELVAEDLREEFLEA